MRKFKKKSRKMAPKTVLVGIDGMPYKLLGDLCHKEIMPNLKDICKEGKLVRMFSSIPEVSSVSWSSIITGQNPGQHGIFGFTDIIPNSYTVYFPNFSHLNSKPFWMRNNDLKYLIINVPFTYPVKPLNGAIIAGFVALDLKRAVYPQELLEVVKREKYKIDVDVEKARMSAQFLIRELDKTLEQRLRVCFQLIERAKWDVVVVVITGSDRLMHFLWDAYEDENHEFHQPFLDFFRKVDEKIQELLKNTGEPDNLIVLSDHGMERAKIEVNLNTFLEQEGFLRLDRSPQKKFNAIKNGTKAFVLDPARVYINFQERYPRGCVMAKEKKEIVEELRNIFSSLKHNGDRVVKQIFEKEEIYRGDLVEKAPDLVLIPTEGYSLKAGLFDGEIFRRSELPGKHNTEAFLAVKGGGEDRIPKEVSVEDVVFIAGLGG
jgi:predicted AlkP superfamily phosphohydrolase/phosphomutase